MYQVFSFCIECIMCIQWGAGGTRKHHHDLMLEKTGKMMNRKSVSIGTPRFKKLTTTLPVGGVIFVDVGNVIYRAGYIIQVFSLLYLELRKYIVLFELPYLECPRLTNLIFIQSQGHWNSKFNCFHFVARVLSMNDANCYWKNYEAANYRNRMCLISTMFEV